MINTSLILLIIVAYFLMLLVIGYFTSKDSNNDAFFRGNKKSPWYIVAIGMVGSSISGVTYISVPGMVRNIDMTYMQTVFGFFFGYLVIAHILLPVYYKLNLTSIYTYLRGRFGENSYKTGAWFFLLSRTVGAAARLYIVVVILQQLFFDTYTIPFWATTCVLIFLILCYTLKSGIKTIIWTDAVQTLFLIVSLILIIWQLTNALDFDFNTLTHTIRENKHARIFVFDDWHSKQHFLKQFLSGIFITIVMTGLDQDMMQKNLSIRTLKDAQKNMKWYGFAFIPVNLLFLSLGILLLVFAEHQGIVLPEVSDKILPTIAASGYIGDCVLVFFLLGITAASFSSVDSALTALTTSFCIDILDVEKLDANKSKKMRMKTHIAIAALFVIIILLFDLSKNQSIIDSIFVIASYTYGPLLGLFSFGLFTKKQIKDKYVAYSCIASPIICFLINEFSSNFLDYAFGYELLIINGMLTFLGLIMIQKKLK